MKGSLYGSLAVCIPDILNCICMHQQQGWLHQLARTTLTLSIWVGWTEPQLILPPCLDWTPLVTTQGTDPQGISWSGHITRVYYGNT